MRISESYAHRYDYATKAKIKNNKESFAELIVGVNKIDIKSDKLEISDPMNQPPVNHVPVENVHFNVNDGPIEVGDGLKLLTPEQRAMLNGKYNIHNIQPYSDEYNALMGDLYNLGAISKKAYIIPLDADSVLVEKDGMSFGYTRAINAETNNRDLTDWLKTSIDKREERYQTLKNKVLTDDQDKAFMNLYASQKNILKVFKDIF